MLNSKQFQLFSHNFIVFGIEQKNWENINLKLFNADIIVFNYFVTLNGKQSELRKSERRKPKRSRKPPQTIRTSKR